MLNFAIFTRKHLYWSLFYKVAGLQVDCFIKRDSIIGIFCDYCFKNNYFKEHLRTAAFEFTNTSQFFWRAIPRARVNIFSFDSEKLFTCNDINFIYLYSSTFSSFIYLYLSKDFSEAWGTGYKMLLRMFATPQKKKKKKKKPPPPPTTTTISMWNVKFVLCFSVISVLATNKLRVNELLSFHCPFSDFSIYRPVSHSVRSVRIRSYSGPYFPAFGLNKCGKMRTRITPNSDTFYAVSEAIKRSYFRSLVSFLTRKELFIHLYI